MREGQDQRCEQGRYDPASECPRDASLLALHAGGDLLPGEAALLRRHLEGCLECRRTVTELRDTRDWVRLNLPAVDARLLAELRRRVGGRLSRERPFPWLLAVLGRAWVSWRNLGWQPVRGVAVATLLVVGALGALPSLNGRMMQTGGFPSAPAATEERDARPVVGTLAEEPPDWSAGSEPSESEEPADEPVIGLDRSIDDLATDPSGLRIEMQTRDPNVRIIWFASNTERGP